MTDNITLPREVVEDVLYALVSEQNHGGDDCYADSITALRTALSAPKQEHPGYVIGSHWLETAYSRICAGEAEADVLRDIGLVREEAFLTGVAHLKAENEALRRDAERYRWLQDAGQKYWIEFADMTAEATEAAIDAAMENKP